MLLDTNIKFILKSSTDVARAYVNSSFFKFSLQNCKIFKIVSDIKRLNEKNKEDCGDAGPKFLKELKNMIQSW
jgi:hypothetical protein